MKVSLFYPPSIGSRADIERTDAQLSNEREVRSAIGLVLPRGPQPSTAPS